MPAQTRTLPARRWQKRVRQAVATTRAALSDVAAPVSANHCAQWAYRRQECRASWLESPPRPPPPANPPAMAQDIPVESTEILYDHDAREVNLNMKVKNTMAPLPPQGHVAASHEPHQAGRGAGQPGAQHEDGRVGVQAVHDVPWRAISARTQGHQPPAGPPCSRACVVVLFAKGLDIDSSKLKWVATT